MRPALTLREVFGTGHLFSGRISFGSPSWMAPDPDANELLTGLALTVAGDLPMVIHRGVADDSGLGLIREAGLALPDDIRVYDDAHGYRSILASASERVVLQHVHPPEELDPDRCWLPPELLAFLNNKANLPELVAPASVPQRTVVPPEAAAAFDADAWELPLVVKVATNESIGGGRGVRVCHSTGELQMAVKEFAGTALVIEEFVQIQRSHCVQFATTGDASIRYLGAPEQIVRDDGRFVGSWLEPDSDVPAASVQIARTAMEHAVARGYRGFAGVDVAHLEDDRFVVLDLNFRMNGSTSSLLLARRVADERGTPVMRLVPLQARSGWDDLTRLPAAAVRDHQVIPLCTYRPPDGSGEPARLLAMVAGTSRTEVDTRLDELRSTGLE
jgi:hypothetical protein